MKINHKETLNLVLIRQNRLAECVFEKHEENENLSITEVSK